MHALETHKQTIKYKRTEMNKLAKEIGGEDLLLRPKASSPLNVVANLDTIIESRTIKRNLNVGVTSSFNQ